MKLIFLIIVVILVSKLYLNYVLSFHPNHNQYLKLIFFIIAVV
jgi:hypothetical protein